jgi:hypothetical protein
VYADELLKPWLDPLVAQVEPDLYDCHTHVGECDPSGFAATAEDLLTSLELAGSRAAVFPLKEPEGYAQANRSVVALADEHPDRLIAFARIDPADRPLERAQDALDAGALGIKLHPAGEEFELADPRLDGLFELIDAERLPVIVHAGPEIAGVGETALELCRRHPGMTMILAHDALTDLSWIFEALDGHPNLFFDTSWWGPVHTMALFALVPPGRILSASDLPYCSPLSGAITTLRCGLQAGISSDQLRLAMGGQFARLVAREEPEEAGEAPGLPDQALHPLLERVFVTLLTGLEALQRGGDMGNAMSVTRHALKVTDDSPLAPTMRAVGHLLDLYEAHHQELPKVNQYAPGWDLIAAAALVARTPAAPLPDLP